MHVEVADGVTIVYRDRPSYWAVVGLDREGGFWVSRRAKPRPRDTLEASMVEAAHILPQGEVEVHVSRTGETFTATVTEEDDEGRYLLVPG